MNNIFTKELYYQRFFWVLLIFTTLLRLTVSGLFPLTMDEAYYWDWSRNISLSYYDHPPLIAYLIYLTNALFGTSEFSIRIGAVILGSGVNYLLYKITSDFFNNKKSGFYAALISMAIPIYGVGGIITTPDIPLAFFWVLSMYLFYYAAERGEIKIWLIAGVAAGFCFLSKYTGLFLIPSVGLYLILSPSNRKWITRPHPYLSLLAALCVFSPVLIWNMTHEWVSFGFQFSHGFSQNTPPGISGLFEYLGTQAGIISPFLFILVMVGIVASGRIGLKKNENKYLFLFVMSAPMFCFFALLSIKSRLEANWPVVCYFGGIIAIAGLYNDLLNKNEIKTWMKNFSVFSISTGFVLTAALYLFAINPIIILPKIEEVHFGWAKLGSVVGDILDGLPEKKEKTFIFSNLHQITAELAFYVKGRPKTYQIQGKKRYDYGPKLARLKGMNGLYVSMDGEDFDLVKKYFNSTELVKILHIKKRGKLLKTFNIYKCFNYKGGLIEV